MTAPMAARILRARLEASQTQTQLAEFLGINRSAVAQWERLEGGTNPSIANLCKIADVTKVSFEWLATGRGTPRRRRSTNVLSERDHARNEYESKCLHWLRKIPEHKQALVTQLLAELARQR